MWTPTSGIYFIHDPKKAKIGSEFGHIVGKSAIAKAYGGYALRAQGVRLKPPLWSPPKRVKHGCFLFFMLSFQYPLHSHPSALTSQSHCLFPYKTIWVTKSIFQIESNQSNIPDPSQDHGPTLASFASPGWES